MPTPDAFGSTIRFYAPRARVGAEEDSWKISVSVPALVSTFSQNGMVAAQWTGKAGRRIRERWCNYSSDFIGI